LQGAGKAYDASTSLALIYGGKEQKERGVD
jgi:hypothetical protein